MSGLMCQGTITANPDTYLVIFLPDITKATTNTGRDAPKACSKVFIIKHIGHGAPVFCIPLFRNPRQVGETDIAYLILPVTGFDFSTQTIAEAPAQAKHAHPAPVEINRAIAAAEIRTCDIGALQVIPTDTAPQVKPLNGLRLCGDWQAKRQDHQ